MIFHISQGPTRTSRTFRPAPRSPRHHTTHTRAQTHTTRQDTPSTTARRRHGACHPKQRTPSPQKNHTQSHTRRSPHAASAPHSLQSCQAAQRRRDAARELVVVQVHEPAGHSISHRITPWHPTPPPNPASRPQRISAHSIASIKSRRMKASHLTACYRSRTTPCASDPKTTQTDSHRDLKPPSLHTTLQYSRHTLQRRRSVRGRRRDADTEPWMDVS
jgi:hypothetical protein